MELKFYMLNKKIIFSEYDLDLEKVEIKTVDTNEKHVPVVEKDGNVVTVKVGDVPHPMTEEHHIEYILVETNKGFYVQNLDFNKPAFAKFNLLPDEYIVRTYAYCNLHGVYKKEN